LGCGVDMRVEAVKPRLRPAPEWLVLEPVR
jgi:hypothetical protein